MSSLSFSTQNLIALHKLEATMRRECGDRHLLSEEGSLLALIKAARASGSIKVQAALVAFIRGLTREQQNELADRGALKNSSARASGPDVNSGTHVVERSYRGVKQQLLVAANEPVSQPQVQAAPAPAKAKRIYRGRVID